MQNGDIPEKKIDNDVIETTSGATSSIPVSYLEQVSEFIHRNELLDAGATYYLYKFDNASGNQKSFIAKYAGDNNNPPDEDEIGRTFGSGRYLVILAISKCESAPKGYMRSYIVKIHSHYDTLRSTPLQSQAVPPQQTASVNNFTSLGDTLGLIERMVTILAPLFKNMQSNSNPDFSTMLFKNYETTSEVLKRSMMENIKTTAEMTKKMLEIENKSIEIDEPEEEEESLIETLKPLIVEWLPKLLGDGAQSTMLQQVVKATPQFKKIINNKREFKILCSYLDETNGKDVTDQVLKTLKLKRC